MFEEICGEPLINLNQTWYTSHPTISSCFSRTILLVPPTILIILSLIISIFGACAVKSRESSVSQVIIGRIVLLVLALAVFVSQAALELQDVGNSLSDYVFYGVMVTILLCNIVVECLHHVSGTFTSAIQFFFWLIQLICCLPILKNNIENFISDSDILTSILSTVFLALNFTLLATQWFTNWTGGHPSEDKTAFPSWLTFSWMSACFSKGYKSDQLVVEDLPNANSRIHIDKVLKTFLENFESKSKKVKRSTLQVLIKSFGGTFFIGGLLRLTNDILLYMTPFVFRKIIQTIEEKDHAWKGYMWVTMLLITATCQITVSNHYFRQTFVAAFQMRTAIVCAIYRKTLTISNLARKDFSTGEITNLMSIDAQRFIEIVPYLNTVWSGPFQFGLAIYFLFDLVGYSALAGLAVFFILVPINIYGGKIGRKIQMRQMGAKDGRILLMNEILQGMRVLKLYAWEKPFMGKINDSRGKEIKSIKDNALLQALLWITYTGAPLVVTLATFIVYIFSDPNNVLTAEKVFGTVAVFNVVRIPMNQFPRFLMESVKLLVSLRRIDSFLNCEDLPAQDGSLTNNGSDKHSIEFTNASYSWIKSPASPTLDKMNIKVKKGELVAVVGKIGSGKSSLISAVLGEIEKIEGDSRITGRISYVAQQAWIQNMSVKDNILFGKDIDEEKYNSVLDACALASDLEILPSGDLTEIGENGVNLSGGQKQRVGLARAAYEESDIVLLDDPLSAVDAHVGKHLFDRLIGPTGILQNRTRILVTHNLSYLHKVDRIILMDEGKIVEDGSLEELSQKSDSEFREFSTFIGNANSDLEEMAPEVEKTKPGNKGDGKLIAKEVKTEGRVSLKHYKFYLSSMNIGLFILVVLLFLIAEGFKVGGNLVLAFWTENFDADTNWNYIGYYSILAFACTLSGMISQISCQYRAAAASEKLHHSLLDKTMHAPMNFFETTPTGRILNRFTSDLDVVDAKIPQQLKAFLSCITMIIGTLTVVTGTTPLFLAPLVPISICYGFLQVYFTRTRRQVKRLESIAKSPIFSHFSETIMGAPTIRAFGQQNRFFMESESRVAHHLRCNYISDMSNRWLSIRVEFLGNCIVFFAALFAFYSRDKLSAGVIALSISYAMQMIDGFGWTIRMAGELESDSVALERIREYEDLPQEAVWDTPGGLAEDWPKTGNVEFKEYSTKYRPELSCVLEKFNLQVENDQKVGIVGRTGAGKSSLSLALFRIIEPFEGSIFIDGKDISKLGLQDLRSKLTIIPQEPTLFSGTIRFNLDPGNKFADDAIHQAIERAGLTNLVGQLSGGLEHCLAEGGAGLSLGQRQLLCLARALLRKSKLLVLDEATAAVDTATDDRIQNTIRTEFDDCTVLTIAHRLNTITGGDIIIVLDKGKMVEQGEPKKLMENASSQFYGMARAAGILKL